MLGHSVSMFQPSSTLSRSKYSTTLESNAIARLEEENFQLSPTQIINIPDGNSLTRAISDQLSYNPEINPITQKDLRIKVVRTLHQKIEKGEIKWEIEGKDLGTPEDWMEKMLVDGVHLDEMFLRLTSLFFSRKIKVLHVIDPQPRIYEPRYQTIYEPLYLLNYEENICQQPHYQSIRPLTSK